MKDLILIVIAQFLICVAIVLSTKALQLGKEGGPIQAIISLKAVVTLVYGFMYLGIWPNAMQTSGMILALVGATMVSIKKK